MIILQETEHNKQIVEKEEEYMEYIKDHINNVHKAFENMYKIKDKFEDIDRDDISDAIESVKEKGIINIHDESKYSDEEFDAYRRHFHSVDDKEKEESEEDFELAWKHHYENNPHHPEYWIKDGDQPVDMKIEYIVEMACDWIAMSYSKGGTALKYLEDNREKKQKVMTENTMSTLETILNIFYSDKENKEKE